MTAVPVAPSERQPALDVLRGAALLGILLVNVQLMAGPQLIEQLFGLRDVTASALERVLGGLIGWLVAGKFISSFSILFGVGAALIAERALARGRAPRRLLARRYGLLMLAGLAYMVLLFPGDVLFLYGVIGLVLLAFLRARDRTLSIWIVALLALSAVALTALSVSEAGAGTDAATHGACRDRTRGRGARLRDRCVRRGGGVAGGAVAVHPVERAGVAAMDPRAVPHRDARPPAGTVA